MKLLLENIKELVQVDEGNIRYRAGSEMAEVHTIRDAFLIIRDELIQEYGPMSRLKDVYKDDDFLIEIDCSDRLVYPAYCDSNTQLVFPSWGEKEFVENISMGSNGLPQHREKKIISTSEKLHQVPDEQLYRMATQRINEIIRTGTGAVEIKSGCVLSTAEEIRILRIIKKIRESTPVTVRSTLLGAHVVPNEFKDNISGYMDVIVNELIPQVASEELSDFIDIPCDNGLFSTEDIERIISAGLEYGLLPKMNGIEYGITGRLQIGIRYNALSVAHLDHASKEEIEALKNSDTMPTVLPGISFFLGTERAPVREMIKAGLPVALASGYNPDSSPSGNMNFISSLGCINYKMLPQEVINATTLNGAYAMGISDRLGSIARGKIANLFITSEISGIEYLPYAYGSNLVETVILNGEIQLL